DCGLRAHRQQRGRNERHHEDRRQPVLGQGEPVDQRPGQGFHRPRSLTAARRTRGGRIVRPMPIDYLKRILTAKVYDVADETPLEPADTLSGRISNRVLLKREDMQPVFSFKLRGAYNRMARLSPEQLARGVIAASAGNHAQGVALAARRLGCRAVIVMPVTTPQV